MGHGLDTSGQRTANRPANRCRCLFASIHKKGSRSEVLPDALGRSSKQREPPRNLHRKLWSKKGREIRVRSVRNQFGSTSSSLREISSSSSSSSFYSSRRSRSAFNSYLPYLTASILLGTQFASTYNLARTCVKSRFPRLGVQFHPWTVFFTTTRWSRHGLIFLTS